MRTFVAILTIVIGALMVCEAKSQHYIDRSGNYLTSVPNPYYAANGGMMRGATWAHIVEDGGREATAQETADWQAAQDAAAIAAATNGVDWKFRDTNNVMVLSGTNELATISMAIESNTLNRQSAYIYSGSLDYDTFTSGKIRFAVTFYNQKSNAPVLQGITTESLVNPNGYKWVMDEYDVLIDPITHTNSTVKKTSKGTSANVLIEYLRKITE